MVASTGRKAKKVGVWLEGVQPCSPPQCPRTPPGENIAYPFPPLSPTHCNIAAEMQPLDEIISSCMDVYRQGVRLSGTKVRLVGRVEMDVIFSQVACGMVGL